MSYSLEEKIKWSAILSRAFILILQLLSNILIPDHDAGVFQKPSISNLTHTFVDSAVNFALEGLSRWDSQYFLHIAQYGYTYENTLAFFPFFPLVVRQFSYFVLFIVNDVIGYFLNYKDLISVHSSLLLSATVISNLIFIKTAIIFYKLSLMVVKDKKLSYMSTILFCINPASIFFSAAYSESLYCFLIFYGLLQIEQKNFLLSSILIGLSGLTRSNGIINIGFLFYSYLKFKINKKLSCLHDITFSICLIVAVLPFAFYQLYCYLKYCFPGNTSLPHFIYAYGIQNKLKFPGNNSSWCDQSIPFAYSYVQRHYWDVGFLRYYQLKQIPNFVLAIPVFLIVFRGFYAYVRLHKSFIFYLGFRDDPKGTPFPITTLVYVVHCLALSLFAIFMIHIQVATRLLFSSSPVPYWFSAWFMMGGVKESVDGYVMKKFCKKAKEDFTECYQNRKSRWKTCLFTESFHNTALCIKYYYLTYLLLGTFMFSNYLPWT